MMGKGGRVLHATNVENAAPQSVPSTSAATLADSIEEHMNGCILCQQRDVTPTPTLEQVYVPSRMTVAECRMIVSALRTVSGVNPCCGEYASCDKPCTPRGRYWGQQEAEQNAAPEAGKEPSEAHINAGIDVLMTMDATWSREEARTAVEHIIRELRPSENQSPAAPQERRAGEGAPSSKPPDVSAQSPAVAALGKRIDEEPITHGTPSPTEVHPPVLEPITRTWAGKEPSEAQRYYNDMCVAREKYLLELKSTNRFYDSWMESMSAYARAWHDARGSTEYVQHSEPDDATDDQLFELNSALERESVRKLVKDASPLAERFALPFRAGFETACEEIMTRLEIMWGERPDPTPPEHVTTGIERRLEWSLRETLVRETRLLDALNGMVGLVQLVQERYPDFPVDNHRVIEALSAIKEAEAHRIQNGEGAKSIQEDRSK